MPRTKKAGPSGAALLEEPETPALPAPPAPGRGRVATRRDLERHLSALALALPQLEKPPTVSEQLKAAELLLKMRSAEPEGGEAASLQVEITVLGEGTG